MQLMNSQKKDRRWGTETMLRPINMDIRKSPKVWHILACVCICILVTGLSYAQSANKSGLYSDRIAAVVNGYAILESDIKLHKQPFVRNFTNLGLTKLSYSCKQACESLATASGNAACSRRLQRERPSRPGREKTEGAVIQHAGKPEPAASLAHSGCG